MTPTTSPSQNTYVMRSSYKLSAVIRIASARGAKLWEGRGHKRKRSEMNASLCIMIVAYTFLLCL